MSRTTGAAVARNPFPGLRPFREDEGHLFFGRASQVDAMVDKLAATRFLAVVGTSGSGKSSLVNCGLRPALRQGLMVRAGTAWRMAPFRPGSDPLGAMAHALAEDGVLFRDYQAGGLTLAEIVDTTLRMSKLGLIDIYEQAQSGAGANLLVVVDQFEELFRYRHLGTGQDEKDFGLSADATTFVNLLLEAGKQTTHPIYVVLTMRSDFLGDCAQFGGLAEAINAGQYLVPRMTREERRAAIRGPVGVGGAEISPVMLTRLVNDVGDNPDQLSILQHALNRTWAHWESEGGGGGPLDLAHYQAIGSMAHALDQHAEKAYAELGTARRQQICEKLFRGLTDKTTDPRGVRRPTTLGTLCALADATEAEVTEVMEVFRKPSRSFLMPPAGSTLDADTVIDISHESLMRVWRRLKDWAEEEARSAQTFRRLSGTAARHAAGHAALLRDPDLQLALDWRRSEEPTAAWASLYQRDIATVTRFLQDSEAQIAEEERIAARTRRTSVVGFGIVLVIILLNAAFGTYSLIRADRTFKEYHDLARQTNAAGRIQANMLMTGIFARNFLIDQTDESIEGVERRARMTEEVIEKARELAGEVESPYRTYEESIEIYRKDVGDYEREFGEVTKKQRHRDELVHEKLNVIGPETERELTEIMRSAHRDGDIEAAYRGAMALRNLMLARLYAQRFLLENEEASYERVLVEFEKLESAQAVLEEKLENAERREIAARAREGWDAYRKAFAEVHTVINERNQIIQERLDRIGQQVAGQVEDLKLAIKEEQDTLGPRAEAAIGRARWITVVLTGLAIAVGGLTAGWLLRLRRSRDSRDP